MNALAQARTLRWPFRLGLGRLHILMLLLVLELAFFGALKPAYLSLPGLLDASRAFLEAGILALGMTLVLITGRILLSCASLFARVSLWFAFRSWVGFALAFAFFLDLFVRLS